MPKRGRATRERAANRLQDEFEKKARELAEQFNTKGFRTRTFHRQFSREYKKHTLKMATLGAGRELTPREIAAIERRSIKHKDKMLDFVSEVSINRVRRTPRSSDYIGARAELYAGHGRGEFFRFAGIADADNDTVERYETKGDRSTCSKCRPLHGQYFLPGEGTMPGEACKGRGRCRCRRVQEQNARKAKQLRRVSK